MLDAGLLHQLLTNLRSNALKFTAQGTVTVEVGLDPWGAPAPAPAAARATHPASGPAVVQLCIVVADTGIGIAAAVLPLLFKPFVQADGSISRKYGGSGLGLTIVKQLCELMGGTISLSSSEGVGSTVTILIPAEVVFAADDVRTDESAPDATPAASAAPAALVTFVASASAVGEDPASAPACPAAGGATAHADGAAAAPATLTAPGTASGSGTRSGTGSWRA
jgi:hypothetical protein